MAASQEARAQPGHLIGQVTIGVTLHKSTWLKRVSREDLERSVGLSYDTMGEWVTDIEHSQLFERSIPLPDRRSLGEHFTWRGVQLVETAAHIKLAQRPDLVTSRIFPVIDDALLSSALDADNKSAIDLAYNPYTTPSTTRAPSTSSATTSSPPTKSTTPTAHSQL